MISNERRRGVDRRRLTGAQRAAALLIVLGKDVAPRLLRHMEHDEIREITRAAATLGIVDRSALERMIDEFQADFAEGPDVVGDLAEAQQLVSGTVPPQDVARMLDGDPAPPRVNVWAALEALDDKRLTELLISEPPWIGGTIAARLGPERAAAVLENFTDDRRSRVLTCMLTAGPISPMAMELLESSLLAAIDACGASEGNEEAPKRVADIVNRMGGEVIDDFVSRLSSVAPDQASAVRALLFKFEEVEHLSPKDRTVLFDGFPTERVILALKNAPPGLVESILASLGARARRMVEAELANDAQPPQREVNAARRMITETALRLASSGAINITPQAE